MDANAGPHPLTLIICRSITRERADLPATYSGVVNMFPVVGQPGQVGGALNPTPSFQVEARFAAGLARGSFRFGLRVTIGSGEPTMLRSAEVRLLDGRQEVRLARTWQLKRVPDTPIWFESLVNDWVVMRVPFTIPIIPPPSDERQA